MGLRKYKYYFRKPKSAIAKDVITALALAGAIYIAAGSPYFVRNLLKGFKKLRKYPAKKVYNTFYLLKKQGCLNVEIRNNQIYISLTEERRKKAGWMQVDVLKISKPKKWDKKWRLVIFDIAQLKKVYREAFRGKLKELGFYLMQKSIWAHPFDCRPEVELLKDFFGLSDKEMKLIIAQDIGDDRALMEVFDLT